MRFITITLLFCSFAFVVCGQSKGKRQASKKPSQKATLTFEAGINHSFGGMQKIARENFFLLDTDFYTANKITNKRSWARNLGSQSELYDAAVQAGDTPPTPEQRIYRAIEPHIVESTMTDFNGKGRFTNLKRDSYLVYYGSSRGQMVVWSIPVNSKTRRIVLDQNNAEIFKIR